MAPKIDPRNIDSFSNAPEQDEVELDDVMLADRSGTIISFTVETLKEMVSAATAFGIDNTSHTGDGSTTTFLLPLAVTSATEVMAFVDGQQTRAFSISSDSSDSYVVFDSAPVSNAEVDLWVLNLEAVGNFLQLTDTPAAYSGATGSLVRVDSGPTGLEFFSASADNTVLGRADGGGAGAWQELTATQLRTIIGLFTATARGLVPLATATNHKRVLWDDQWGNPGRSVQGDDGTNYEGSLSFDYDEGQVVIGYLSNNMTITGLSNIDDGDFMEFWLDLQGFTLAVPGTVRWPDSTVPSFGTGHLVLRLHKKTEDTVGGIFYGELVGKDFG